MNLNICERMSRKQFDALDAKLNQILTKLDLVLGKVNMAAKTLDDVIADTTAQTTVVNSVVTMLSGLSAQLKAALASGDPVKIQEVATSIEANTTALANAVAAGTPAPAPAPVPAP